MCPWKVDTIQKLGQSKCFIDFKKSTASYSIFLFVEKIYLDDPCNRMLTRSSSQWFNIVMSRLWRLSRRFVLCLENKEQYKRWWLVVLISVLQRHDGLTVPRNLWQNLCSFRWLKLSVGLFKSLIPVGPCTSKIEFSSILKLIKSDFLNLETDGRFLILAFNLFHSLIQKWRKVLLKFLFCCRIE